MTWKLDERSREQVQTIQRSVKDAAESLQNIVDNMIKHDMENIVLTFSDTCFDWLFKLTEAISESERKANSQFLAKELGIPNPVEEQLRLSQETAKKRKRSLPSSAPVGRPRKRTS